MIKVVILFHSACGHTEALAHAISQGVIRLENAEAVMIRVEDIDVHWSTLLAADAIIFGTPTYMGGVSASLKSFMDQTGRIWQARLWKDKIAAAFTCSASLFGDKMTTLQQINVFAMQHGMIWVGLDHLPCVLSENIHLNRVGSFLGLMAYAPNEAGAHSFPDEGDRETARYLGERVARIALRWSSAEHE